MVLLFLDSCNERTWHDRAAARRQAETPGTGCFVSTGCPRQECSPCIVYINLETIMKFWAPANSLGFAIFLRTVLTSLTSTFLSCQTAQYAARYGHAEPIRLILKRLSQQSLKEECIYHEANNDWTPLHFAARWVPTQTFLGTNCYCTSFLDKVARTVSWVQFLLL